MSQSSKGFIPDFVLHHENSHPLSFHSESTKNQAKNFPTQFGSIGTQGPKKELKWNGFYNKEALTLENQETLTRNPFLKSVDGRLVNEEEKVTVFNQQNNALYVRNDKIMKEIETN